MKGQIVFAAKATEKEDYELYLFDLQTGVRQQLTDNIYEDIAPDISPDGRKVAFSANRNGVYDLFVLNLETLAVDTLVADGADPRFWQPSRSDSWQRRWATRKCSSW